MRASCPFRGRRRDRRIGRHPFPNPAAPTTTLTKAPQPAPVNLETGQTPSPSLHSCRQLFERPPMSRLNHENAQPNMGPHSPKSNTRLPLLQTNPPKQRPPQPLSHALPHPLKIVLLNLLALPLQKEESLHQCRKCLLLHLCRCDLGRALCYYRSSEEGCF